MVKKLGIIFMTVLVALIVAAPTAFANEEHACKADADCAHGEHCKDGHCHK